MTKHVLTNNFFFLEDSIDFPNKEELINEIQKLENLAKHNLNNDITSNSNSQIVFV